MADEPDDVADRMVDALLRDIDHPDRELTPDVRAVLEDQLIGPTASLKGLFLDALERQTDTNQELRTLATNIATYWLDRPEDDAFGLRSMGVEADTELPPVLVRSIRPDVETCVSKILDAYDVGTGGRPRIDDTLY
jgi:hypothetical protein